MTTATTDDSPALHTPRSEDTVLKDPCHSLIIWICTFQLGTWRNNLVLVFIFFKNQKLKTAESAKLANC